ncbi:hypothetical protein KKC13_12350 [bacterium]|nr:hypothetical protein [bacterium]MBU1958750.1 hypothetical protein [bacterium]
MGIIEEKIKEDLMQTIFADTANLYDFIESRFTLEDEKRNELIALLNTFNNDLTLLLKSVKLL